MTDEEFRHHIMEREAERANARRAIVRKPIDSPGMTVREAVALGLLPATSFDRSRR